LATLLNVGVVLYGRLNRTGAKFELAMRLESPADDSILWHFVVTRDTNDLADIENEVAETVARVLRAQLALPEVRVRAVQTEDPQAHALVLRASHLRGLRTQAGMEAAAVHLDHAVRRDSNYVRAWNLLAATTPDRGKALAAARRAIALDSTLAEPHVVIGRLYATNADTAGAMREYLLAIRRDPRLASARYEYSLLLAARRHLDEALREARRAHELDPLAQELHRNYVQMLSRVGHDMEAKHETAELRRMAKYLGSRQ
jgi:serine/threonine-protein kinase